MGTIELSNNIKLHNVLYVPKLSCNIILIHILIINLNYIDDKTRVLFDFLNFNFNGNKVDCCDVYHKSKQCRLSFSMRAIIKLKSLSVHRFHDLNFFPTRGNLTGDFLHREPSTKQTSRMKVSSYPQCCKNLKISSKLANIFLGRMRLDNHSYHQSNTNNDS
ncbi:hypothetical protein CR513_02244, partial [Mucuna pruriens]